MSVHFVSGLPRSGSTLLCGLLRQNPRFHAAMSSPVAGLMNGLLEQTAAGTEFHTMLDSARRARLCRALFDAYYADIPQPVIFDTNRQWTARLHQLVELFDDFKVLVCVRNPAWIVDSFERIHRRNPFDYSRLYGPGTRGTVYTRAESLMSAGGAIGSAWGALKEAFYGEWSERLLVIDYELLTTRPQRCFELIYDFLGEARFGHDFEHVEYAEEQFDAALGARGLHTVQHKVAFTPRRSVLPPDLFAKYSGMEFWRDSAGSAAHTIAPKKAADAPVAEGATP